MATATASAPAAPPRLNPWVVIATVWHGLLGAALIIVGVLALIGTIPLPGIVAQVLIGIAGIILGGVQLLYLPGLWSYRPRSRVMSLAINFAGLALGTFVTFRQMTCVNVCRADPNIFAGDRLALWLPVLALSVLFGVMAYTMWRKDVSDLFGEASSLRSALTAYLYISPYLLTAAVFTVGLLIYAFALSFTGFSNDNLYGGVPPAYVGLDNYRQAFQDDEFLIAMSNVIWYAIIVVVFQTIISLGLALMMNARFKGRRIFRTLFYAPSVTSSVVISLIFLWLFNGQGIVNYILFEVLNLTEPLGNLGLRTPNTNWLNTPTRLGDLTYLKPFVNGNWHGWLIVPLVLLAVGVGLRIAVWLRDNALNRRSVLVGAAGALIAGAAIVLLLNVLFPVVVDAAPAVVLGDLVLKLLFTAVGAGIVGGLAVAYLKTEPERDTAVRSAVFGVLIAAALGAVILALLGATSNAALLSMQVGANVTLYAVALVLPLIAPLFAAVAVLLSHSAAMRGEKVSSTFAAQPGGDPRRPLDRVFTWFGPGLLTVLAIFCMVVILVAAATSGIAEPNDLGAEEFAPLMLRGPSVAFMVVMLLNIFTTSPTFMIMFLAALQDIPGQLYEAAQIDGASRRQQFVNVTLPMLRPIMLLIVVLGTIGTFQIFDQVHVMTAGGPVNTTLTPVYLIFTRAIGDQRAVQMGYAAAMAFILAAIIFVITYIQRNYIERGTQQY